MSSPAEPPDRTAAATSTPGKRCPVCGKPAVAAHKPFCSPRCSDVDLNRWLGGVYAIPIVETDDDERDSLAAENPD